MGGVLAARGAKVLRNPCARGAAQRLRALPRGVLLTPSFWLAPSLHAASVYSGRRGFGCGFFASLAPGRRLRSRGWTARDGCIRPRGRVQRVIIDLVLRD